MIPCPSTVTLWRDNPSERQVQCQKARGHRGPHINRDLTYGWERGATSGMFYDTNPDADVYA
jgi:hypothetical protein